MTRKSLLSRHCMLKISQLTEHCQEQLMRWVGSCKGENDSYLELRTFFTQIFCNEDRVWRDRGGRPGEETLKEFLGFLHGASFPADDPSIKGTLLPPPSSFRSLMPYRLQGDTYGGLIPAS